ncbi:hypothetical protein PVAND_017699 [Polypedilum vanderplanki]|uniref:MULE transposase domain-containing protein n=1 Tax=Polypedilum vanderplanki TaxID=319348 RepID=A0A9J6B8H6_POLVA|nr:hypothetical protein PVAND_017699 [Polypedilum vanderplanki]
MKNFFKISLGKAKSRVFYELEGSFYKTYATRGKIQYLSCTVKKCQCKARIVDGEIFQRTNFEKHTHERQELRFEYEIAFEKLKNMVLEENRPIRQIYNSVVRKLSARASVKLAWTRVRRHLQRLRHDQMPACSDLETLVNLLETDDAVFNKFGKVHELDFYHGSIGNNFMIFANLELVGELSHEVDFYCDGTFNVTPFRTHQLFIIMAELFHKPRPIVYILMTGRTSQAYDAVFSHVRDAILSFDGKKRVPRSAIADFESGIKKSLKNVWPEISILGCNFHYCQALRRKAMSLQGLSTKINNKYKKHGFILKMYMRLSFLPIDRLEAGHEALKKYIHSNPGGTDRIFRR